ncbi:hypothetical protein [Cryobacterium sp. AP23]
MAAPRKPQDHLPKATKAAHGGFTFRQGGEEFQLADAADVLQVGFARKNRHKSESDQFFTMIEILADEESLDAIDSMNKAEFKQFQLDFYAHNGVKLGESEASSES